jgi:rfaE bifunctional protein kinase chain/domain
VNRARFSTITDRYSQLRLAIVGDFCLDRYLEIDPARAETSIETGLTVHNVARVRSQPGGAGTVLNNLVALGVGEVWVAGMAGEDGEGWELHRALASQPGVRLDYFLQTPLRRTFTYTKPLICEAGRPPRELNRLDFKNWTVTPPEVEAFFQKAVEALAGRVNAIILLEQVDQENTGVITAGLLRKLGELAATDPKLFVLADSRRGLRHFPPVTFKMNREELARLLEIRHALNLAEVQQQAADLARRHGRRVFVTLAEQGLLGAEPNGDVVQVPALRPRGEIDIVGAGDAVTANLTSALAAGASMAEALELAGAASSIVIHKLGTTGTASVPEIAELLRVGG